MRVLSEERWLKKKKKKKLEPIVLRELSRMRKQRRKRHLTLMLSAHRIECTFRMSEVGRARLAGDSERSEEE
jgi:hypothetical protein